VTLLLIPGLAQAVVLHDDAAPSDTPPDAFVGLWSGTASCVPIDENFVLLSQHQGGGFGTGVTLGGQDYTVVKKIVHPSVDLALGLLFKPMGTPAGLTEWAEVHTAADGPDYLKNAAIGGYGLTAGSTLLTQSGVPCAYEWGGSVGTLTWGANYIDRVLFRIPGSDYSLMKGLQADFDHPEDGGGAVGGECSLAAGDSGGGWFLPDGQGGWTVAGLTVQVEYGGEAVFRDSATGEPAPEKMYGVRLSQYDSWILDTIAANQPILGDANLDGQIDIADLSVVKSAIGTSYGDPGYSLLADLDGDGNVDIWDWSCVKTQFMQQMDSSSTTVPEPAVLAMLAAGGLATVLRRRNG
jgi:hypothetical protein